MNLETLQAEHKKYKQLLKKYIEFNTVKYNDIKTYEDNLIKHYKIDTYDKLIDICYLDIQDMELLSKYNNLVCISDKMLTLEKEMRHIEQLTNGKKITTHTKSLKAYEDKGLIQDNQQMEYHMLLAKYEDLQRLIYIYNNDTKDTIHYNLLTYLKPYISNSINTKEFILISELLEHIVKYTKQIDKINLINSVTSKNSKDNNKGKRQPLINALDTIIPYCKNTHKYNLHTELHTIKNDIYQTFTSKGYSVDCNKNIENFITYDDILDAEYFTHRYTKKILKNDIELSLIKYFNENDNIKNKSYLVSKKQHNKIKTIVNDISKALIDITYTIQY
jgi:hypothetical protein